VATYTNDYRSKFAQNYGRSISKTYQIKNKKLDKLTNSNKNKNTQKTTRLQAKVINLTNVSLTKEQNRLLSLGPNYAIEKEPPKNISMS
jgi:hypothetical protein